MKVETLAFSRSKMLSLGSNVFDESNIGELVRCINRLEGYCAIENPLVNVGSARLIEKLIKENVNTDKLISIGSRLSCRLRYKDDKPIYKEAETYELTDAEVKQRAFVMGVLIGWIKLDKSIEYSCSNLTDECSRLLDYGNKQLAKEVDSARANGFTSIIETKDSFGLFVELTRCGSIFKRSIQLDDSKYYAIKLYMPNSMCRFYTGETYAEMLARQLEEAGKLDELGETEYIKSTRDGNGIRIKSSVAKDTFINDINGIKNSTGFEKYNIAIIDTINAIADNKSAFLMHTEAGIQIAFKNSVPVLEAVKKILNAIDGNLEKHMVTSLTVCNKGMTIRDWDNAMPSTCSMSSLVSGNERIDTGLKSRLYKKSSNAETDLIALFNAIKAVK